jgi:hypothetical protein
MAGGNKKSTASFESSMKREGGKVRTVVESDNALAFLGLCPPHVRGGPPPRWVWPVLLGPLSCFCGSPGGNDASRTWRAWYEWERWDSEGRVDG